MSEMLAILSASIKNVGDTRVGDTITSVKNPASEPLAGYRRMNPMVFCGLYPIDTSKYNDLREALEKLELNDSALEYEAETSQALGFGYRCGFLGLLHMEIIQERIEREFNIDLITTAPSVIYNVVMTDGTELKVDNPAMMPDAQKIDYVEEPYVKASIMVPKIMSVLLWNYANENAETSLRWIILIQHVSILFMNCHLQKLSLTSLTN